MYHNKENQRVTGCRGQEKVASKLLKGDWHQWLVPIILATQEEEIRKMEVGSQPGQIVHETLS
jgi:hypothetical protein